MLRTSRYHLLVSGLLLGTAALGIVFQPNRFAPRPVAPLNALIPRAFGDWHAVDGSGPAPVDPRRFTHDEEPNINNPYDDILIRTYQNAEGETVQLVLAYGRQQYQEIKIHRPALCYTAQGFRVYNQQSTGFPGVGTPALPPTGAHMLAQSRGRLEAVSYWVRIGSLYSDNPLKVRFHIFLEGLRGRVDDGMLVRVSQILTTGESASTNSYALQNQFLGELVANLTAESRQLLVA